MAFAVFPILPFFLTTSFWRSWWETCFLSPHWHHDFLCSRSSSSGALILSFYFGLIFVVSQSLLSPFFLESIYEFSNSAFYQPCFLEEAENLQQKLKPGSITCQCELDTCPWDDFKSSYCEDRDALPSVASLFSESYVNLFSFFLGIGIGYRIQHMIYKTKSSLPRMPVCPGMCSLSLVKTKSALSSWSCSDSLETKASSKPHSKLL